MVQSTNPKFWALLNPLVVPTNFRPFLPTKLGRSNFRPRHRPVIDMMKCKPVCASPLNVIWLFPWTCRVSLILLLIATRLLWFTLRKHPLRDVSLWPATSPATPNRSTSHKINPGRKPIIPNGTYLPPPEKHQSTN